LQVKLDEIPGNSELHTSYDSIVSLVFLKGETQAQEGDVLGKGSERRKKQELEENVAALKVLLNPSSPVLSFSSSSSFSSAISSPSPPSSTISLTEGSIKTFNLTENSEIPKPWHGKSFAFVSFAENYYFEQFYKVDKINDIQPGSSKNGQLLTYTLNTSEGQSGSPIFIYDNDTGSAWLTGIHSGRQTRDQFGFGTVITDEIYQWILNICKRNSF